MKKNYKQSKVLKIIGFIVIIIIAIVLKSIISDFLGFQTTNNKLKYEKCVNQDIITIYSTLANKHGTNISDMQKILPDVIFKDFINCVCHNYVYGNPFVSIQKKTRQCQLQTFSKNIVEITSACEQNIKNTVFNEYKTQNIKFNENDWRTKYKKNVALYCVCLTAAKESALTAVEYNLLPETDIMKRVEEQDLKCVHEHLKELL